MLPTGKDFDPVTQAGIQDNLYGFVPFVRRYSGFGRRTAGNLDSGSLGALDALIVSDIKFARDLIREETAARSDINSASHLFAHKPVTIQVPADAEVDIDVLADSLSFGAYEVNVLKLPDGGEVIEVGVQGPSPEMMQHHRDVMAEIVDRNPFVKPGPVGSSGRQQDLTGQSARRRYATVVENTETMWATGFEMGLKILEKVPTLAAQVGLRKEDIGRDDVEITVRLIEDDPVEADRLATLGSRLWNMGQGEISLRENLTEYQGKSPDKAEEIIVEKLVEKVTLESPEWAQVVGMEFATEAGLMDQIEEARQLAATQGGQTDALNQIPATTTERVQGETQTAAGFQTIDSSLASRGTRRPPERFTRGG